MDTTQSYWTPDTGYIRELIAGVSQAAGAAAGAAGAA